MKILKYCLLFLPLTVCSQELSLNEEELKSIGIKVWQNECRGTLEGLIHWGALEEFPSLGIGHFIWYPEKVEKKFEETFPLFLEFIKEREVKIPFWLAKSKGCPWKKREDFLKDLRSQKMQQLRDILSTTLDLQTKFIVKRFDTMEKFLRAELSETKQKYLDLLKQNSSGMVALIDYVNFKGTGLNVTERYRNQGWGLLHVLQEMSEDIAEEELLPEFINSAKRILAKRVKNAHPERKEDKYLKGWFKRLETYAK